MKKLNKIILLALCVLILFETTSSLIIAQAATNTVKTSFSKVESKAKGIKATWKKASKIKGYQIQYSTSSKFTKSTTKSKTISNAKTTSTTISKLKGCGVSYYVRIRTYKTSNGKNIYSSWSKAKKTTTLKHKYKSATCTKAKTCTYCNKTSGKALGHKYSAATCTKAKTCSRCKKTSGEALGHKWSAATCTKAKTCSRCKKTSGEALGHKWSAATCTKAKTCSRCKKTTGSALGHEWNAATCTKAKTCSRCNDTIGSALGHSWQIKGVVTIPTYTQVGEYSGLCSRCNTSDNFTTKCLVATSDDIKEEMLRLINIEREKVGVEPLKYYEKAQIALDARAQELHVLFSHTRPNGYKCFSALNDYNIYSGFTLGENIAIGYGSVESVMNGWMNSPGHRGNILDSSYTHVTIGEYNFGWVQMFFG